MKKIILASIGLIILALLLLRPARETEPAVALTPVLELSSPAPPTNAAPVVVPAFAPVTPRKVEPQAPPKSVLQRIAANDSNVFRISPELVQAFLARNLTNAESLLAAYNVTTNKDLLREAVRRYPNDPSVLASVLSYDAVPEQRRELIDRFKQAVPENPLGNYLSALDYLKNQQPELALKEFAEGSGKTGLNDYSVERIQGLEEMYLSAGHSPSEAKALATIGLQMPALMQLRDLGRSMSGLETQYTAAGDAASAQAVAKMGLGLAANVTTAGAGSLVGQVLGIAAERDFLKGLDPNGQYDFLQQPVNDRLAALQDQKAAIREGTKFFDGWLTSANPSQVVSYFDRFKLYGEASAMNWARMQASASAAGQ